MSHILTGYEIYSIAQLREWARKATDVWDVQFAATCQQAIINKQEQERAKVEVDE